MKKPDWFCHDANPSGFFQPAGLKNSKQKLKIKLILFYNLDFSTRRDEKTRLVLS